MTRRSLPYAALAAAYLGLVGIVTLGPTPWRTRPALTDYDVLSPSTWLDPDTWARGVSAEFVANILLFIPLGLLLRLALPRAPWLAAVLLGVTASVAIEVLQVWSPRISDPRDVLANAIGALVGAVLGAALSGVIRLSRHSRVDPRDAERTLTRPASPPARPASPPRAG